MASPQDDALARTENLLRDAEEALQQERLQAFWRQWGTTLIGMAVMLVIGTGAGAAWREWKKHGNEEQTALLLNLVESPEKAADDKLAGPHAAIGSLVRAGALAESDQTEASRAAIEKLYAEAAQTGDGTTWGWLARWNTLRLRMDDDKADPNLLLKDYESLAADGGHSGLSALALMDAAIVAGERLDDAARALGYVEQAEKLVQPGVAAASVLSDIRHIYMVRAAETAKTKEKTQ